MGPLALIHGYTVAFFWGGMLLLGALLVGIFVINARRQDVPTEGAMPAA